MPEHRCPRAVAMQTSRGGVGHIKMAAHERKQSTTFSAVYIQNIPSMHCLPHSQEIKDKEQNVEKIAHIKQTGLNKKIFIYALYNLNYDPYTY